MTSKESTSFSINQQKALEALKEVDFDWTVHLRKIWQPPDFDVPELNQDVREQLFSRLEKLIQSPQMETPLGIPVLGNGGSGKTHLLRVLRKHCFEKGVGFVLVDMTDVKDFWETVIQGYLTSLLQEEPDGTSQLQKILDLVFLRALSTPKQAKEIASFSHESLLDVIRQTLQWLFTQDRKHTIKYQDCVRAAILANSNDFSLASIGTSWIQGLGVESEVARQFGFTNASLNPSQVVAGLSWLMSLRGPTVVALDQLDPIVVQSHTSPSPSSSLQELSPETEREASQNIIHNIAGGLIGLRDCLSRSLVIISCLDQSWEILTKTAVTTFTGRFEPPLTLTHLLSASFAEAVVVPRLQAAYHKVGFIPPYPSYPFKPEFFQFFQEKVNPRQLLQECHEHREQCLRRGIVIELGVPSSAPITPSPPPLKELDRIFEEAKQKVDISPYLQENENEIWKEPLASLCNFLVWQEKLPASIGRQVETDFPGSRSFSPLHSRLRLIFYEANERERHLCFTAIQSTNPRSFQTRLVAARTAAGIDAALRFRKLVVVRTTSLPGGERTQKLWQKFLEEGGIHWRPSEREIRVLLALEQLQSRPGFTDWLAERQPLTHLANAELDSGLAKILAWLREGIPANWATRAEPEEKGVSSPPRAGNGKAPEAKQDLQPPRPSPGLFVGRRWIANREGEPVFLPIEELVRHTVILAGSGSGKTVLLRRMVEEAALQGIPSIVIDAANDLARLGDPWPAAPEGWTEEDQAKAERYFAQTEVVVWTPGLAAGNPLTLAPLPDFAALAGDPEELEQAVDMAWGALQEIVAPGKTVSDELKRGVLKAALKYFATHQPGSLADFAEFLADLPPEAGAGISKAPQLALQMANLLKAAMVNNKLLHQQGMALDPAILLGLGSDYGKTRVSVVNLVGLPTLGEQQQFLNQLAMALFTWIKKNPAPPEAPVRGLLVIDEAKDFVPSQGTTPCKQSLLRLAAQARKYGLGLIFATQAPKSIDHNVIANCSTQFFGRVTSPAAIEVVREQIAQRGGSGEDVAVLKVGQFYLSSQQLHPPCKIQTPWCLSFHAPTPLSEAEVIQRSQAVKL
jgi:hypothetical protein